MVLVDTSIWSLALRRQDQQPSPEIDQLSTLIDDVQVVMMGAVRQELLSGIKDHRQYLKVRNYLRAFSDITVHSEDYERAADFYNRCREKGIQGSHIDFLICSVAHAHQLAIFTLDKDFEHYQSVLDIRLFT